MVEVWPCFWNWPKLGWFSVFAHTGQIIDESTLHSLTTDKEVRVCPCAPSLICNVGTSMKKQPAMDSDSLCLNILGALSTWMKGYRAGKENVDANQKDTCVTLLPFASPPPHTHPCRFPALYCKGQKNECDSGWWRVEYSSSKVLFCRQGWPRCVGTMRLTRH